MALDADSGELRWHYQFTPHDVHDWDSTEVPVLADLMIDGDLRQVVMFANRNGFYYTLDRTTGEIIVARPFVRTTWATEIGTDGRPILLPGHIPNEEGEVTNWTIEIAPTPYTLALRGWSQSRTEESLKAGTVLTVTMAPSRAGTPSALLRNAVTEAEVTIFGEDLDGVSVGRDRNEE